MDNPSAWGISRVIKDKTINYKNAHLCICHHRNLKQFSSRISFFSGWAFHCFTFGAVVCNPEKQWASGICDENFFTTLTKKNSRIISFSGFMCFFPLCLSQFFMRNIFTDGAFMQRLLLHIGEIYSTTLRSGWRHSMETKLWERKTLENYELRLTNFHRRN